MSRLKNTPLVSVIMPVFNGEKYIAQAIDSILQQTYKKLELIIIDDASTDNTNDIINTIKDKRIKYIKNNKNSKEWYSRNVGLAKAKGDYIAWQDADDMADKKRIDKQLLWLKQHKHHQMVGSDMAIINQYGKWLKTIPATAMNMAWHRQRIFCPTTMFDKKILSSIPQPFFRPLLIGEDIDFLYRVIEKKYSVGVINQPIYFYRRSGQQATHFHFLSLLYGELARYSSYGRRIIKSELLTFPQYRSLDKQHLPNAFKPFLQSKKLSNQHKIFSQRFIIGQIYSFFKQPIVFLSHYRLLYAMNFLLWRYQFLTFLLAHLTTIPKHLVGWLYCRLTHKKFFVE